MKRLAITAAMFALGVIVGAITFSRTIPRSLLQAQSCGENCLRPSDIAALIMSAGIRIAPDLIPGTVAESEKCIGIQHWRPEGRYHVAYFPKQEARNIMELGQKDLPYLLDCLALARDHVGKSGFANYRFTSSGPALQHVSYFHFHVIAK